MSIKNLQQGFILPSKVVVKEILPPPEKKTGSGLIIPNLNRKNPQTTGLIVLVGSGVTVAKEGLKAIFTPLSAQKFIFEDEEYLLLEQSNILFLHS